MSSFCQYYNSGHCRSCEWMDVSYLNQILQKESLVRRHLNFFLSINLEISAQSSLQGFRNRAKMSVTGAIEKPVIGLLGTDQLDEGRELLNCPIHHPVLNELMVQLPALMTRFKIAPYRIQERKGELKGLIAFYSPGSSELYLRFILRSQESVARIKKMTPDLLNICKSLVCVSANIQPIPHAILEGPDEIILTERKSLRHLVGDLQLELSPQAFVQTNTEVATQLYQTAAQWIQEVRPQKMMELFCGQGAFSFFAAKSVSNIMGIEINADAVRIANQTAARLGLAHLSFVNLDATRVEAEIQTFHPDMILVNPPRRGLGAGIDLIADFLPEHFIYSSCSIESLAEDLKKISQHYVLKRVRVFDLFPHTQHFETLIWLQRALKT